MKLPKTLTFWLVLVLMPGAAASAQTLNNAALTGKYFFRHVLFTTDATGSMSQATSLLGSINFDGRGTFTFQGQQTVGSLSPAIVGGSGTYQIQSNGFISMTNPQRSGLLLNARMGAGAIVGSSTEASGTVSDLFVAIPAPTTPTSVGTLSGTYRVATLTVPFGIASQVRNTLFTWTATGQGTFNPITVTGHAANLSPQLTTQTISGATYTPLSDGSLIATFPFAAGINVSSALFGGTEILFISADGNLVIGGSLNAGVHDMLIAVKTLATSATNASVRGLFYTAGIAVGPAGLTSFAGSANSLADGSMISSQRFHSAQGGQDVTAANSYSLAPDGTGTLDTLRLAAGDGGAAFVTAALNDSLPDNFELDIGVSAPKFSGSGVFVNPAGIVNAASFAPVGNPLAPGELFTVFGSQLAPQTLAATRFPLPLQLAGVRVLVNNAAVPMLYASAGQVSAVMPFAATGSKVTIVVDNNGIPSNPVDVPLAATAPGVFSMDSSGTGAGAILHSDFTAVSAASPARRGETVLIYLTGLGTTFPFVGDGLPAPSTSPLSQVGANVTVSIGGKAAPVLFKGLAPTFAGLYQLNVTIPSNAPSGPDIPLAISTAAAFHDQVEIAIQ